TGGGGTERIRGDARDPAPRRGRDGCVRTRARRCDAWRRHALRAGGLRRRGVANRRPDPEERLACVPVRTGHVGTTRGRRASVASGRLAHPDAEGVMRLEALADADSIARAGAAFTAVEARVAVAARGRFVMAVSGGRTPWKMLRALADEPMPWADVHIVQVDERVAPAEDSDPDLTHLLEILLAHCPLDPGQVHAMPVESADLDAASERYAVTLREIAGSPAVLDLAHLGLGPDGHTASLVPGDPVLGVTNADVAVTRIYQGRRRMTLTYPLLNRSRRILWLVTGHEKADMLPRLCEGDRSIPAGRISRDQSVVLADYEAAARLRPEPSRR